MYCAVSDLFILGGLVALAVGLITYLIVRGLGEGLSMGQIVTKGMDKG